MRRRPAPGEWAIVEVVGHLADTEERALAPVRRMLTEDSPFLELFDQAALAEQRRYLDLDVEGELARLEDLRRQHVAELEATGRRRSLPRFSLALAAEHGSIYVDPDGHDRSCCTAHPRGAAGRPGSGAG